MHRQRLVAAVEPGIELIQRFEGDQTVNFARALLVRTRVSQSAGEFQAAFDAVTQAEQLFSEKLGADHLFTQVARTQQAIVRSRAEVIEKLESLQPQSNRFLAQALCERAKYELHESNPTAALESAQQCLNLRKTLTVDTSWEMIEARALVAAAEFVQGSDQAAAELNRARMDLAEILGPDHPGVRWYERWL